MKKIGIWWLAALVAAGFAMTLTGCGGGGNNGAPPLPEVAVLSNEAATLFAADVVEKLEATG